MQLQPTTLNRQLAGADFSLALRPIFFAATINDDEGDIRADWIELRENVGGAPVGRNGRVSAVVWLFRTNLRRCVASLYRSPVLGWCSHCELKAGEPCKRGLAWQGKAHRETLFRCGLFKHYTTERQPLWQTQMKLARPIRIGCERSKK